MNSEHGRDFALEYRLRALDPELHRRFTDGVFGLQRVLSNYKLIFPEYTDHTELHSLTVLDFCNRLIGRQLEKLGKDEIYCLLMGCYFHDTGMGVSRKNFEEFSAQIDFGDYFQTHPGVRPEVQIRDFHNEYSGLFIRKYAEFFEIPSSAHLEAIIEISRGHRKTDLLDERVYPLALPVPGGGVICLPYVAAIVLFLVFAMLYCSPLLEGKVLQAEDEHVGSASALIHFGLGVLAALGTAIGSLPWPDHIVATGLPILFGSIVGFSLIAVLLYAMKSHILD